MCRGYKYKDTHKRLKLLANQLMRITCMMTLGRAFLSIFYFFSLLLCMVRINFCSHAHTLITIDQYIFV